MLRTFLAGVWVWLVMTACAFAQGANPFAELAVDTDAEIHIAADATLADFEAQTATYMGNVVVTQGQMKLRADELKIFAPKGRIHRIIASGKVVLASPSGSAQGSKAVYEVLTRVVTLSGGVILTHENNVMRGSELEVRLATGEAQLVAAVAEGGKPGRVQALFAPVTRRDGVELTTPSSSGPPTPVPKPGGGE